jgi:DNA-damage-inducible protein D
MSKREIEKKNNKIALFEGNEIRRVNVDGDWYYSIEDTVKALTGSVDPKGYIKDMRRRDEQLSEGWGQIATPLPMKTMSLR